MRVRVYNENFRAKIYQKKTSLLEVNTQFWTFWRKNLDGEDDKLNHYFERSDKVSKSCIQKHFICRFKVLVDRRGAIPEATIKISRVFRGISTAKLITLNESPQRFHIE